MYSLVANVSSVSPKVPTQANISTGWDLTMINKHCKFSKWNWFKLDSSDMTYLLSSEWPAQIQVSLCALPPSLGLQHALQCCKGFLVSLQSWLPIPRYKSDVPLIVGIYFQVRVYSLRRCIHCTLQTIKQASKYQSWRVRKSSIEIWTMDPWNCRQVHYQLSYVALVN
jgi:hypothetical protein